MIRNWKDLGFDVYVEVEGLLDYVAANEWEGWDEYHQDIEPFYEKLHDLLLEFRQLCEERAKQHESLECPPLST